MEFNEGYFIVFAELYFFYFILLLFHLNDSIFFF